ncbi:MAG: 50S ribosomal protein L22 [Bacteroidales bacterium]|nr:50S ribosomal protein L22 [Bacteroidales bacterium]
MGARKHNKAEERKAANKSFFVAKAQSVPTSPRKMRLVADLVRGMKVELALHALQFSPKEASNRVYKLLRSAIANWEAKNEGARIEDSGLYIQEIFVDAGRMLKRVQPAPQGRAHRVRKRSNHVTLVIGSRTRKEE